MACGQFRFLPHPQSVDGIFPRQGPVTGVAPATESPAFPQCAHRLGAVLHKWSTWLCTAKPARSSPARLAGSSPPPCRCLREAAGTPDADLAWAWLTSSATAGAGARAQAARAPRRLPAVTLIVILPAARPRYAQAARAQSPPELVTPACATTTRSRSVGRRSPSATAFSRRSPASNGRRRGAGPGGVSLPSRTLASAGRRQAGRQHYRDAPRKLAARSPITTRSLAWPRVITAPRPPRSPAARSRICGRPIRPGCSRDDAAPGLAGQRSDRPARVCCRRGGSRAHSPRPQPPEDSSVLCPDPRSSRLAFRRCRRTGPGEDVPAGQNQARPLHV